MEAERPHHHNSTSELFICFTSRLSSSSSMKLSSKSILSPSRNREPSQVSLSSSLSRRLRSNGSIKNVNGQGSPMFPTNGKKRGCAFENPEPSSPKVTCIGQVRVKTKKQGKKMRARSKRRDASFRRKTEQGFSDLQNLQQEAGLTHRNQRWVHLPLTICEALRAFGAEFSCLFPCRSSSCGREKEEGEGEKVGKGEGSGGGQSREGSCGAAFARWLVALQEGDAKGREIELVVGEEHEEGGEGEDRGIYRPERSRRRHVFEDIEVDMEKKNEEEEEKARVSICIPPKNALLLMRCRSDPVKMAALANRFWESPAHKDEDEGEEDEEGNNNGDDEDQEEQEQEQEQEQEEQVRMEEDEEVQENIDVPTVQDDSACGGGNGEREIPEAEAEAEIEVKPVENGANPDISEATKAREERQEAEEEKEETKEDEEHRGGNANQKDETLSCVSSPEVQLDLERPEPVEVHDEKPREKVNDERESSELTSSSPVASESDKNAEEQETSESLISVTAETSAKEASEKSTEKEDEEEEEEKEKETKDRPWEDESKASQVRSNPKPQEQKTGPVLPDCLLLMMCEPKLSMEVSKETWVCSTDFIRWLPERPAKRKDGGDEPKKRTSVDSKPPPAAAQPMQPPRSSCSLPAAAAHGGGMSMASMIEQKLLGSNAYEPFVLTRCKSEPMRSSAKLAPDACFWKNRKLEPHHRPATLGVGAAGVGF